MERRKAAADSRLMRLAQKRIVGGALLLDRVANSHLWVPAASLQYSESRILCCPKRLDSFSEATSSRDCFCEDK